MNKISFGLVCIFAGLAIGAAVVSVLNKQKSVQVSDVETDQPLYWVAPMDANYRRDEPGKSPMGMDLVPVYEQGSESDEGVVSISPLVENNLGVRTTQVIYGPLQSSIRTVGYVRFDDSKLLHMHPRVEGWIEKLNVKTKGEYILAGQEIYSIYSPTLVNAQEELVLSLERNNQRLIQSAEERLLALQVHQQQIDELKETKTVMQTVPVFAPQDGLVAELGVSEGQFVQPGNPILSIGVLDDVWVIAEVFERQVSLVTEGDEVSMTLDYLPGRVWQGEVDFIYPTLDETTRTVQLRLLFQNPEHELKPNMFAQVVIHNDQTQTALLIPNEAVIRTGVQDRVVLVMGEGRYKSVEVSLGRRGDTHTEIMSGLQVDDEIVISAQFLLDSESSISSDFNRMYVLDQANTSVDMSEQEDMDMSANEMNDLADIVWSAGKVERKMSAQMMTITHEAIPEWEWPTMTMMFEVAEGVDISDVEIGSTVEIQITRKEGGQIITSVRAPE